MSRLRGASPSRAKVLARGGSRAAWGDAEGCSGRLLRRCWRAWGWAEPCAVEAVFRAPRLSKDWLRLCEPNGVPVALKPPMGVMKPLGSISFQRGSK